jgi:hypothetical protein
MSTCEMMSPVGNLSLISSYMWDDEPSRKYFANFFISAPH